MHQETLSFCHWYSGPTKLSQVVDDQGLEEMATENNQGDHGAGAVTVQNEKENMKGSKAELRELLMEL